MAREARKGGLALRFVSRIMQLDQKNNILVIQAHLLMQLLFIISRQRKEIGRGKETFIPFQAATSIDNAKREGKRISICRGEHGGRVRVRCNIHPLFSDFFSWFVQGGARNTTE